MSEMDKLNHTISSFFSKVPWNFITVFAIYTKNQSVGILR